MRRFMTSRTLLACAIAASAVLVGCNRGPSGPTQQDVDGAVRSAFAGQQGVALSTVEALSCQSGGPSPDNGFICNVKVTGTIQGDGGVQPFQNTTTLRFVSTSAGWTALDS